MGPYAGACLVKLRNIASSVATAASRTCARAAQFAVYQAMHWP